MFPGEAIDWLFSLHRFGIKLGLDNIRALTEELGRPQDRFGSVLIAGTNGKGSTAAMLHQILLAAGIRSGLYTSPHLVRTEERIRIGDSDIDAADLTRSLTEVRARIETLRASGTLAAHPTFFEVMTAAAFFSFARAGIEIAVLEVGLGGRFDATNVVEPLLSVITTIDLDHQEQLGDTLGAIAREKAGVLRSGTIGLVGEMREEPLDAIREEAEALGARLVLAHEGCRVLPLSPRVVSPSPSTSSSPSLSSSPSASPSPSSSSASASSSLSTSISPSASSSPTPTPIHGKRKLPESNAIGASSGELLGQDLTLTTPVRSYPRLHCPLPGAHQRANLVLAVAAAEILGVEHPSIDERAVTSGLEASRWPCRLEWHAGAPPVLLDGAHNPAGCRSLTDYLATLETKPVLIFAAMRDKQIPDMLAVLLPAVSAAVFTRPSMERAAEPSDLLRAAREIGQRAPGIDARAYIAEPDAAAALGRARALAGPRGSVLVAGSLFLAGAIKEILDARRGPSKAPASDARSASRDNPNDPAGASSAGLTGASPIDSTGPLPSDTTGASSSETMGASPIDPKGASSSDPTGASTSNTTGASPSDPTGASPSDTTGASPSDPTGASQ